MDTVKRCGNCDYFEEDDQECGPVRDMLNALDKKKLPETWTFQVWEDSVACSAHKWDEAHEYQAKQERMEYEQDRLYDEWRDRMMERRIYDE